MLHDPDADPELLDFGGEASTAGRARVPQVRYTYQGPYGTVLYAGFENPVPRAMGPFGQIDIDSQVAATTAPCSITGNTAANLPVTTACIPSTVFTDALKSTWPELIGSARINNPWGHLRIAAVVRTDTLNDGQYLDRSYVGYGGTISGDVHPFSGAPGPLGKDDLGFGTTHGVELGGQVGNGIGLNTNFGAALNVPGLGFVNPLAQTTGTTAGTTAAWNTRGTAGLVSGINVKQAYDRVVRTQSPNSHTGWIWYQHWWTENLRSTLETSAIWNSINTNITPGQGNKLLGIAHGNLIWSPVAFVDIGAEFAWGHRVTTANFKGDAYSLQGSMRVRF
jgi:hypothetical protein